MRIIKRPVGSENRSTLLHYPEALARHPTGRTVLICRVSEESQRTNGALYRQQMEARDKILEAGGRLIAICGRGRASSGRLSSGAADLKDAIATAGHFDAILACLNLSRLLRAEDFDQQRNPWAVPTPEEIAAVLRMAGSVPLALLEPPELLPEALHSRATERGMRRSGNRPGPDPQSVTPRIESAILELRDRGESFDYIAETVGLSRCVVRRICAEAVDS